MSERLLELIVTVEGREHRFSDQRLVRLGRDPDSDVVVDAASVSRHHATLERGAEGWLFRDAGSSFGSYRNGGEVPKLLIRSGEALTLSLGGSDGGADVEVHVSAAATEATLPSASLGRLSAVHQIAGRTTLTIGRDDDADIVVEGDLSASRRHAEIRSKGDSWEIADLHSHNGTFLNGVRIHGAAPLMDGDLIAVGAAVYRFVDGQVEQYEARGEAWLLALDLCSELPNGRRILDGVSFPLAPTSLMAVVGPSGAGKTTLLGAVTGFRPPSSGSLIYGGRDLYAAHDELRSRIGYVPQDDVLHPALTVRAALRFAARLRFAPDVDRRTRDARVDEVLAELNLTERARVRIDHLSGGQRKRVSVALELLTKPELLFLDEPTSGLDPGNEEQVMGLLRELADGGRTVIVVTHSVQSLELCDRLLFLAAGGTTAYFGTPAEALAYFARGQAVERFSQVFRMLDEQRDRDWRGEYVATEEHAAYVGRPLARAEFEAGLAVVPRRSAPAGQSWLRQLVVLTHRYAAVLAADRRNLAILAIQAPLFGLLYVGLIGQHRFSTSFGQEATMLIWLLVVGATWLGTSNAVREIVKEYPVFRRERSVGLSPSAYVASKVLVLGPLTVLQTVVMVLIAMSQQQLPAVDPTGTLAIPPGGSYFANPMVELCVDVALAGLAAMALGLAVSALVKSSDRALVLLPLLLITQVIASVPFFEPGSFVNTLGDISSAQWGTSAAASTTSLNDVRAVDLAGAQAGREALFSEAPDRSQTARSVTQAAADGRSRWRHRRNAWLTSIGFEVALSLISIAAAIVALRRRDRVPQMRPA
ncbi:MAG: transport system ATP-binding/permease protein [Gaiellales bacterium]|nr:transport system ATP-binding/permease protein [Gaiellales bacterium]